MSANARPICTVRYVKDDCKIQLDYNRYGMPLEKESRQTQDKKSYRIRMATVNIQDILSFLICLPFRNQPQFCYEKLRSKFVYEHVPSTCYMYLSTLFKKGTTDSTFIRFMLREKRDQCV